VAAKDLSTTGAASTSRKMGVEKASDWGGKRGNVGWSKLRRGGSESAISTWGVLGEREGSKVSGGRKKRGRNFFN